MSDLLGLTNPQLAQRFGVPDHHGANIRVCLMFDSGHQVDLDAYDDAVDALESDGLLDALEAMTQANVPTTVWEDRGVRTSGIVEVSL
jgi:hypothetical protein